MKINRKLLVISFTIALCVVAISFQADVGFAQDKLNLGMIDSSPSKIIKRFKPLMEYLNSKGVPAGKIVVAKTIAKMIQNFESGKVDFLFESPYGALEIMDKTGAVAALIREKKGVKEYNAVIFVKKDSSIQSISELKGRVIAFEDPASTSSYLLPKSILTEKGLSLKKSRKPVSGAIAYYFSKDDDNTIVHVKAGKADAGGIKKSKVAENSEFRTLTPESAYVPRHVLMVRKGVAFDQLKKVLLSMKSDSAAASVLKKIKTPTGFSEFDGDSVDIMNTQVRNAMGL